MSVTELVVNIVYGTGGPNHNAIPIYSDNKAPHGGQVMGPNGLQLMLENSEISGIQYIIVNPKLLTKDENANGLFVTFKPDGTTNYVRMWIRDPETGEGRDYAPGVYMWGEYSHLQSVTELPPVDSEDKSTFEVDWVNHTIIIKPK